MYVGVNAVVPHPNLPYPTLRLTLHGPDDGGGEFEGSGGGVFRGEVEAEG